MFVFEYSKSLVKFIVWIVRGTPLMLQLIVIYFGPGLLFHKNIWGMGTAGRFTAVIVAFIINYSCYFSEIYRGGIEGISKGQYEAATALGYSDNQSFFKILLPQAAKHFLPIYRNEVVTLIKETSVAGYIAIQDLTKISDLVRSRTYEPFFPLVATAVVYFVLAAIMTAIVNRVEININPKRRPESKILEGIKEWE